MTALLSFLSFYFLNALQSYNRGRPKNTWIKQVEEESILAVIVKAGAQNRLMWRAGVCRIFKNIGD